MMKSFQINIIKTLNKHRILIQQIAKLAKNKKNLKLNKMKYVSKMKLIGHSMMNISKK